jgi:hypothetical protein
VSSGETIGGNQLVTLDGDALARAVDFSDSWLPWWLLDELERTFADAPPVLHDPRVAALCLAVRGSPGEQLARQDPALAASASALHLQRA